MVDDDDILSIVKRHQDIRVSCTELIAMANEHGGEDNVTAVLVKIQDGAESTFAAEDVTVPGLVQLPSRIPPPGKNGGK